MNNCLLFVFLYLMFSSIYNVVYKVISQNMKKAGSLTVLIEIVGSITSLTLMFLFKFKLPNNKFIYLLVLLSIIFYTIQNRLATTSRSKIKASSYGILKQISSIVVFFLGILFLKEDVTIRRVIAFILLLLSNVVAFYSPFKNKFNKYLILGVFANIFLGVAMFLDIITSKSFNISFYIFLILFIPALINLFFEKISFNDLKTEWISNNKKLIILTGMCFPIMTITKLYAYKLGEVSFITPLCSLTVILNVLMSYVFLNEKVNVFKNLIASTLIVIGLILLQ